MEEDDNNFYIIEYVENNFWNRTKSIVKWIFWIVVILLVVGWFFNDDGDFSKIEIDGENNPQFLHFANLPI